MIGRVSNTPGKSLGDLELKQNDANRTKLKKSDEAPDPEKSEKRAEADETSTAPPPNIRYLGRKLDLIA